MHLIGCQLFVVISRSADNYLIYICSVHISIWTIYLTIVISAYEIVFNNAESYEIHLNRSIFLGEALFVYLYWLFIEIANGRFGSKIEIK